MTAAEIERVKALLPVTLGSDEIRTQIAREILQRSVFSARMASMPYLAQIREVCGRILDGTLNESSARMELEDTLEGMGHQMSDGGGLKNPASIRRLNLIVETQTQMAASVAQLEEQTPAVLDQWPAWELTRLEGRAVPRADWPRRWAHAGDSVDWDGALKGRFIALKSSPIWQALGDGAGGFRDTLGNPYPPFAYSSGMGWVDVDAETCASLGLTGTKDQTPGTVSLSPSERDIADAAARWGFDPDTLLKGVV